jgi:hypothetical protein
MGEINSNQEQDLNNNNNLQEINQFYNNNSNNTYTNNPKEIPTKYIMGGSIFLILCGLILGYWIYILILPLLWLMYWIFKFYKKVSWQRYNYSIASLIILGVLIFYILLYSWPNDSNVPNFLPLIFIGVIFALLIIWSAIIVPIFILYHRIKDKDKLNNVYINTQNNYSENVNQPNSNKNRNILISIFLILFVLFIFNTIVSVLMGFSIWELLFYSVETFILE